MDLLVGILSCAACTSSPQTITVPPFAAAEEAKDPAQQLAAMMAGKFTESGDTPIYDFRFPLPAMGKGQWIYYQRDRGKREAGDKRTAYRQRVFQLLTQPNGMVTQITWRLKNPDAYNTASHNPRQLLSLKHSALVRMFTKGCEQRWTYDGVQWSGRVDPKSCMIFSKRRNRTIAIGSQTNLSQKGLQEAERGFDLDGNQLWGTAPGAYSEMLRTDP
ncbi:MAG: chromophore lyase CpcT/CpeT [Parasphingorhabdus sp.]|uniref:chromophore lyase CpcT/CpeT n=1 Tax=Parasphingorhabdus sp. TaxID=2709688 RepID=UPI003296EC6F